MSDIVLSAGVRSNLLQLQQTSDLITQTQTRLATGKKVNSALDNAINFFTAQGLDNRANDLSSLLDSMSNAINTIQAANNGITAITKLVQSQQSLASQAQQTTDPNVRATLASQFDALTTQIAQLAGDSGFNGVNLLGGNTLTVTLDETGNSSTSVAGVDYSTVANVQTNLTIDSAVSGHNAWANTSDIQASSALLTTALTDLRSEIADSQCELVDCANPSGFHEGDNQHTADRFFRPHARRFERGRCELACPADPPAAVNHSFVAGLAGRPERAAPFPISSLKHE